VNKTFCYYPQFLAVPVIDNILRFPYQRSNTEILTNELYFAAAIWEFAWAIRALKTCRSTHNEARPQLPKDFFFCTNRSLALKK